MISHDLENPLIVEAVRRKKWQIVLKAIPFAHLLLIPIRAIWPEDPKISSLRIQNGGHFGKMAAEIRIILF